MISRVSSWPPKMMKARWTTTSAPSTSASTDVAVEHVALAVLGALPAEVGGVERPPRHADDALDLGRLLERARRPARPMSPVGPVTATVCRRSRRISTAIASAVRWASAMIVIIGLTPDEVGKALASPIHTPLMSCSSPHGPATLSSGSVPMRQVPIWWAEKIACSRGASEPSVTLSM